MTPADIVSELAARGAGAGAETGAGAADGVPYFVDEFWTARQRQAHRIHEISYRACFKPQLPAFFIERLTQHGDVVYDPFMGRGTTPIEAALRGRIPYGNDANPLSRAFTEPRINPPDLRSVQISLNDIPWDTFKDFKHKELLTFYHPKTLAQIEGLRGWLLARQKTGAFDKTDGWIRMVALNRLTGHSPGFFSVYTMPPNQAVSVKSQEKINQKRNQTPPFRDVLRSF
ncbi:MAG: DNA methyltransferase [Rhodospirillales bacterium]